MAKYREQQKKIKQIQQIYSKPVFVVKKNHKKTDSVPKPNFLAQYRTTLLQDTFLAIATMIILIALQLFISMSGVLNRLSLF